jgi:hypothetical protein
LGDIIATETIRPSKAAYRRAIAANAIILLPLLLLIVVRMREAPVGGYIALLILLVIIGVGLLLYFRNARLDFGDGQISRTTLFAKTMTWNLTDIGTVLAVRSLTAPMQPPTDNLFILDTAGRVIIRATDQRWAPHQMRALVEATEKTPVIIDKPTDARAVREQYPRAIAWWEAHPFKVAFACVGAFFVLLLAGFALYHSDLGWILEEWFWTLRFRLGLT